VAPTPPCDLRGGLVQQRAHACQPRDKGKFENLTPMPHGAAIVKSRESLDSKGGLMTEGGETSVPEASIQHISNSKTHVPIANRYSPPSPPPEREKQRVREMPEVAHDFIQ
jgi:hypothetical protein